MARITEPQRVARELALADIPDTPATLEFRAVALDAGSSVYRSGDGLLLVESRGVLACAMGNVAEADVQALYQAQRLECELLADERAFAALQGIQGFGPATILALDGPWQGGLGSIAGLTVRELRSDDSLTHLPSGIRADVAPWLQRTTLFCGLVDQVVACIAYAPWQTETLADIAIDTLPQYRRRGIGARVASALVDHIIARGRSPIWGAADFNVISLLVAGKLGFRRPAGRLFVNIYPRVIRGDGASEP